MVEPTSLIFICCFELFLIGRFINHTWRIFFDNSLSVVLNKLETIHEKSIHLNVAGPMNIRIVYWTPIVVITVNVIVVILNLCSWIIMIKQSIKIEDMVITNILTYLFYKT